MADSSFTGSPTFDFFDESVTFRMAGMRIPPAKLAAVVAGGGDEFCWAVMKPGQKSMESENAINLTERTGRLFLKAEFLQHVAILRVDAQDFLSLEK